MLTFDERKSMQATKDACPGAVIFFERDGLFAVVGEDARHLARRLRSEGNGGWLAFDVIQAAACISRLQAEGSRVLLCRDSKLMEVTRKEPRSSQPRIRSSFIAVDPLSPFEQREIESAAAISEHLYSDFKLWLSGRELRRFEEFGQIYVIAIDRWFEIDSELTTMLPNHAKMLAKAALELGVQMPCRLVEPKSRRHRKRSQNTASTRAPKQELKLGQLQLL